MLTWREIGANARQTHEMHMLRDSDEETIHDSFEKISLVHPIVPFPEHLKHAADFEVGWLSSVGGVEKHFHEEGYEAGYKAALTEFGKWDSLSIAIGIGPRVDTLYFKFFGGTIRTDIFTMKHAVVDENMFSWASKPPTFYKESLTSKDVFYFKIYSHVTPPDMMSGPYDSIKLARAAAFNRMKLQKMIPEEAVFKEVE